MIKKSDINKLEKIILTIDCIINFIGLIISYANDPVSPFNDDYQNNIFFALCRHPFEASFLFCLVLSSLLLYRTFYYSKNDKKVNWIVTSLSLLLLFIAPILAIILFIVSYILFCIISGGCSAENFS